MHSQGTHIHIVSYSFPPDNVPAAHRPYQLARYCADQGIPYTVHALHGRIPNLTIDEAPARPRRTNSVRSAGRSFRFAGVATSAVGGFAQVDKGMPWALRALPKLVAAVRADKRTGVRPVIWATAPLVSNLGLAWAASVLAGAEMHVDLRDAVDGINSRPMPWLTRKALRRASSVTTVTPSIAKMIDRRTSITANVVYNGISEDALKARMADGAVASGWIDVAYAGALYGGDRPYRQAIEFLRRVALLLPSDVKGIRLRIATREALDDLLAEPSDDRFCIEHCGELSKQQALDLAARSHVNLLLLGSSEIHRCAIPLKTYDLLGVGRPVLYFGPGDADALEFMRTYSPDLYHAVDSERDTSAFAGKASRWLCESVQAKSASVTEPSASSQSRLIMEIVEGVA